MWRMNGMIFAKTVFVSCYLQHSLARIYRERGINIAVDQDMTKPQQNISITHTAGQRYTLKSLKPCGARRLAHDPIDVIELLSPLIDQCRELVTNKSVRLEFVHDDIQNVSVFDENKLFQIAACLLQNAADSTTRGTIAVIAKRESCWFRLTVMDTGRGDAGVDDLITARKNCGFLGGSLSIASKTGEGSIAQVSLPILFLTGKDMTAVPLDVNVRGRRFAAS
jgi:hypothetical protein